jgi:hypothetical protein|tara:strand:+ start:8599 stop:9381 length:783 start_codon:yes stop_codon:yes gene_type:complete
MLSIIITHYQAPVLLKLCLDSIKENIGDLEYEMIVVDSQSEPAHQDIVEERFPQAQFIPFSKNVGCAKIVNAGIKAAKGDYVLILNYDIIISGDSIQRMLEFIKSDPEIGIVGPQLLGFDNSVQNSCFKFPSFITIFVRRTFLGRLKWGKKKLDQFLIKINDFLSPKLVDWLQGSAMLVSKKAIDKVGLWDERFFMYLEDTDWCRRFWQNDYQVVYLSSVQMYHYYSRTSKRLGGFLDIFNKYAWIHFFSAFKYFWKWRH